MKSSMLGPVLSTAGAGVAGALVKLRPGVVPRIVLDGSGCARSDSIFTIRSRSQRWMLSGTNSDVRMVLVLTQGLHGRLSSRSRHVRRTFVSLVMYGISFPFIRFGPT